MEFRTVDELSAELWPTWEPKRRRRWIYRQIEAHGLPSIRLGRQVVLDVDAVHSRLDRQRCGEPVPDSAKPAVAGIKASRDRNSSGQSTSALD